MKESSNQSKNILLNLNYKQVKVGLKKQQKKKKVKGIENIYIYIYKNLSKAMKATLNREGNDNNNR